LPNRRITHFFSCGYIAKGPHSYFEFFQTIAQGLISMNDHIGVAAMVDESSLVALYALISVTLRVITRAWTHGIDNFILIVCESIKVL